MVDSTQSMAESQLNSGLSDYFRLCTNASVYVDPNGAKFGGIGVAIFNSSNDAVLELSEPLGEALNDEVAGLEAFVRGLEIAVWLQLRIVFYNSVRFNVHSYLKGKRRAQTTKGADLLNRANRLKDRFYRCHASPSTKNDQLVLNLARSAITQQLPTEQTVAIKTEKCSICLDDEVNTTEMTKICRCGHSFCSSCTKTHIQSKVRGRELPKCPDPKCGWLLDFDLCKTFLDKETRDVMDLIVKEKSIPATERVYCPNPRCSYLMSRSEAFETRDSGPKMSMLEVTACRCVKCGSRFCVSCKVMWHYYMSCDMYKTWETRWNSKSDDAKLKALVGKEKWRGCPRCSNMVELAHGCNHISCRCGHEFCYVCGKEWRKKRICGCPLWDEANIIFRRRLVIRN